MQLTTYHQSRLALGCDTTLVIVSDQPQSAIDALFASMWLKIFKFEQRFSRFLPNSELSVINSRAGLLTHISQEMHRILSVSQAMHRTTNGLFNPFLLPALQRAGYVNSAVDAYADDPAPDYRSRSVPNFELLSLSDTTVMIPYGSALDLGGIGKGYLADALAEDPKIRSVAGFWFSLGGDIRGGGTDENGQPWKIHIQDAHKPEDTISKVMTGSTAGFGVATSGVITRKGVVGGRKWHHLIDPRTLEPATTNLSLVTVVDSSATKADVLASCATIIGSVEATKFLEQHEVLDYYLKLQPASIRNKKQEQHA